MSAPSNVHQGKTITLRVTADSVATVKAIAHRDVETAATIWRRLIKRGLEAEVRAADGGQ